MCVEDRQIRNICVPRLLSNPVHIHGALFTANTKHPTTIPRKSETQTHNVYHPSQKTTTMYANRINIRALISSNCLSFYPPRAECLRPSIRRVPKRPQQDRYMVMFPFCLVPHKKLHLHLRKKRLDAPLSKILLRIERQAILVVALPLKHHV